MDEDLLPLSSHATTVPSSPPDLRYRVLSPTSSEPPLFSSDDAPEAADVSNYVSPRYKRKRAGAWWESETAISAAPKRRQFTRNFDSGVYMMSESSGSMDMSISSDGSLDVASDPPVPQQQEYPTPLTTDHGAIVYHIIHTGLEQNNNYFSLESCALQDQDLNYLQLLNQVIKVPLDASIEVPVEGQYRSMVPELHISLANNLLRQPGPPLFNLQHLTSLSLRENSIEHLPPQIANLKNLRTLDLTRNNIRYFPLEMLGMFVLDGKLDRLDIMANPILEEYLHLNPTRLPVLSKDFLSKFPHTVAEGHSIVAQGVTPLADRLLALMLSYAERKQPAPFRNQHLQDHHRFAWVNYVYAPSHSTMTLMSRTAASYFDQAGRLLKGSPAPPTSQLNTMVQNSLGVHGVPSDWFDSPSKHKGRSLFTTSFLKSLEYLTPAKIREECKSSYYGTPSQVEHNLQRAEQNMASVFEPIRHCHCCGKEYVIARAEWFEVWAIGAHLLPFKVMVCSWGCVPDIISQRPTELKWLDAPSMKSSAAAEYSRFRDLICDWTQELAGQRR